MRLALARLAAVLCLAAAAPVLAAPNPAYVKLFEKDAPGSRDHPWTGRYEGSHILLQTSAAYDELSYPIGPALEPTYSDKKRFSRTWAAEGRVTRTVYVAPEGRSSLEVFRNFQNHLAAGGFKPAWQCAGAACGESFALLKYNWRDKRTHVRGPNMETDRTRFVEAVFNGAKDVRYALMQKGSGAGAAYVGVYMAINSGGSYGDLSDTLENRVTALVEVLEPKSMEDKIVTVKADALASELQADGSVSLYGLLFDTDKADLKPASRGQLDEMVKYLKANPALRVYIVGHTDNQGALDYNQGLSDRRAKAVVAALAASGVAQARMAGRGVGPLAPVASNAEESGRAKNRRVELVLQ